MNAFELLPWIPRSAQRIVGLALAVGLAVQAPWVMSEFEDYIARGVEAATQFVTQIVEDAASVTGPPILERDQVPSSKTRRADKRPRAVNGGPGVRR